MSSRPKSVTWPAPPHTLAKIEIVKKYSFVWAKIISQSKYFRHQILTYIDGFAGPGMYSDAPIGSPRAALASIREAKTTAKEWFLGGERCIFIESDPRRVEMLGSLIGDDERAGFLSIDIWNTTFTEGIRRARNEYGSAFLTNAPLLAFIDPFGAKGVPFRAVAAILGSRTSEVILNFDADGIDRIWSCRGKAGFDSILNDVFGDSDWQLLRLEGLSQRERCFAFANHYKQKLRAIKEVDYTFAFEMGTSLGRLNYFLIFATRNKTGLIKMKEVMKDIDQTGEFQFYDALKSQGSLFKFGNPEDYVEPLVDRFRGLVVPIDKVGTWILNETPIYNVKQVLRPAALAGRLEAVLIPGESLRAVGEFPDKKVKAIRFME